MRCPAAPPALALLAGCAFACARPVVTAAAAAALWLACVAAVIAWRGRSAPAGVLAALFGFWVAGAGLTSVASREAVQTPLRAALVHLRGQGAISDTALDPMNVVGRLTEDAALTDNGVRLALRVRTIEDRATVLPADGGVLVTVSGAIDPETVDRWRRGRFVALPVLLRRPARYLDPGIPDQEAALARRGITMVGFTKSAQLVRIERMGSPPAEWAGQARAWARRVFEQTVGARSPRSSAILRAVILGDRAGLDDETELRLQEAGTYHVLAISGGNIAILAGLLVGVGRVISGRRLVVNLSAAVLLVGYAYLVGGGASVNRATVMAVIYLVAHAWDHGSHPMNILAASAFVSAAVDPLVLYDAGAWLTYGATLAILVGTPWMMAQRPARHLDRPCGVRPLLGVAGCRGRAVSDRRVRVLAGDRGGPRRELRRHPADDDRAGQRHGAGRRGRAGSGRGAGAGRDGASLGLGAGGECPLRRRRAVGDDAPRAAGAGRRSGVPRGLGGVVGCSTRAVVGGLRDRHPAGHPGRRARRRRRRRAVGDRGPGRGRAPGRAARGDLHRRGAG